MVVKNRRRNTDRRVRVTHPLTPMSLQGRRSKGRRQEDIANRYVDRYSPVLRYICIGFVLLSMTDAFFTLRLLDKGGSELNPIMAALLDLDIEWFIYVKLIATSIGLAILLAHFHFRWLKIIRVSHILYSLFGLYVLLIHYEVFLLWRAYSL